MRWPHYEHIFFDCDSTLTTIEGIDVLAESVGKRWRVEVLTKAAMDGHLDLKDVYNKRLRAVRPNREQIRAIYRAYKQNITEDAAAVIHSLQALGHKVYIISGGLAEPVVELGIYLGVPREHIRAVNVAYNQLTGRWWQQCNPQANGNEPYLAYEKGALTVSDGKAQIVQELLQGQNGRSLLIGDGTSDLLAQTAVDLFVGFTGVIARPNILTNAPISIHSPSLAPLLLLAAGPAAYQFVQNTPHQTIFDKAFQLTDRGAITFNHERLNKKFWQAYQTVHPRSHRSETRNPGRTNRLDDWAPDA
ncbi:MAG: hypothetical protein D6706_19480 [Chloroflexi bacterium]|nr:MAG: hypothetical protein D6706_19480 [Chloroflexota bacterium]